MGFILSSKKEKGGFPKKATFELIVKILEGQHCDDDGDPSGNVNIQ